MGYFSNGTEGEMYQNDFCFQCAHWTDEYGCPVWLLHELHVGEKEWAPTLDKLIPREGVFNGQCVTWRAAEVSPIEAPLRPGQEAALKEWKAKR